MNRIVNRQVIGVVLVALLVVTAGCSGLTGDNQADAGDEQEDEEDEDETNEDDSTTETTAPTSTVTDRSGMVTEQTPGVDGSSLAMGEYQFSEGETYSYSLASGGGVWTWEVTDVSGDQITVETTVGFGDQTTTSTYEGTASEVFTQVSNSGASDGIFVAMRAINVMLGQGQSLTVGNTWTIDAENFEGSGATPAWESARAEVTGTDSYNGIDCSVVEITPDNGDTSSFCVNPNTAFVLSFTTESQGQEFTLELSSTSR